jgi:hypothetical protein
MGITEKGGFTSIWVDILLIAGSNINPRGTFLYKLHDSIEVSGWKIVALEKSLSSTVRIFYPTIHR